MTRHTTTAAIGIALALGLSACGTTGSSEPAVTVTKTASPSGNASGSIDPPEEATPEESDEKVVKLREHFTIGPMDTVVTDVVGGIPTLADEYDSITAQGQYVRVDVTAKNDGATPTMVDYYVSVEDKDGRTYNEDEAAFMLMSLGELNFYELNPGQSTSGAIVFDVPADAEPMKVHFTDDNDGEVTTVDIAKKEKP